MSNYSRFPISPIDDILHTVRLIIYIGGNEDLSIEHLQRFIDAVEVGKTGAILAFCIQRKFLAILVKCTNSGSYF
ncbi:MAG: hypothetical protein PUP93_05330 [Rhizonema sp. NSF051]|nr:hypothetical protein [Rhizonema sp. NSF051]